MVALGMAGLVVGLMLGWRFTAFALLPVELTALSVAMWAALVGHAGWGPPIFAFLAFWLTSQAGYAVTLAVPAMLRRRVGRWA